MKRLLQITNLTRTRLFSALVGPMLLLALAMTGSWTPWCNMMQSTACCCCDGDEGPESPWDGLAQAAEQGAPTVDSPPCCTSKQLAQVPDAVKPAPEASSTPAPTAAAALPASFSAPARFDTPSHAAATTTFRANPCRAGPPTASARCALLQRYTC